MEPTLSELAALAAKVEGFERPTRDITCPGGCRGRACVVCDGPGDEWDNSPAALLMAVHLYVLTLEDDGGCSATVSGEYAYGRFRKGSKLGTTDEMERTPEGIARAALVALLRAHRVDVRDD